MKKSKLFLLLSFAMLTCVCTAVLAQTDSCIIKLKNANTGFEKGDYDGTIKLLTSALANCNLNKDDKIAANKLLIMSYLKVDKLEEADKAAEAIMKIDPNYVPDKFKDDPKYSALFDQFQPTPVFRIGFNVGINGSAIDVVQYYSIVHQDNLESYSTYNSKTGFRLGLQAEYRAYKNLWVGVAGMFRQWQYEHILDSIENTTIHYSEKISYVDVPLSLRYYILDKTFSPYVEAGANFSFFTNALGTTSSDNSKDIVNRTDYRNSFSIGYFGGAGLAYKMKSWQFFADFRYNYYPDNVNKDGTRYSDLVNVFKYYYIDDDFRMHNWQLGLGVNYNVAYKNKKK